MEIKEALQLLNGWWTSNMVSGDLTMDYRRPAFEEAYGLLTGYKEVIILTGLRRIGKTTIMYQIVDALLKKIKPQNIAYFTFDYGSVDITSILYSYREITGVNWKEEKIYLFLDEVQKLNGWSQQVKMIYDAFPNIRFIISGSASLQLEHMAMDDLAGRHYHIDVPVLSINEYYSLRHGKKLKKLDNIRLYEDDIGVEMEAYIRKPFPGLAGIDDERRIYEYIRESVTSKIIGQDLIQEFKKVDIPLLNSLVNIFFSEPGMILNIDSLSRALAKRKQEVERHIYMLEFSKLIRVIKNYRPSTLSESRKQRKVYPYDISMSLAENPSIDKGKIVEALIVSRLNIRRYWREGGKEVDCLMGNGKNIIPVEVKSSDAFREEYIKNLNYFISKFKQNFGVLIYNGKKMMRGNIIALNIKDVLIFGFYESLGEWVKINGDSNNF